MYKGLETVVGAYSSRASTNMTITYSKLEINVQSEAMKTNTYETVRMSAPEPKIINLDNQPIALISSYKENKDNYSQGKDDYSQSQNKEYFNGRFAEKVVEAFNPNSFLSTNRASVQFVGDAREIKDMITETFMKTTGMYFPSDIIVRVCNKREMKHFNNRWQPNVNGFCFNKKEKGGISEVFVLEGEMDSLMLTIGHEIGHCLSRPLDDPISEEAKAFAFSMEWAKKIKEFNIGGLGMNIEMNPANNGLHDVALSFVIKKIMKGEGALEVYRKLVNGELSLGDKDGKQLRIAI